MQQNGSGNAAGFISGTHSLFEKIISLDNLLLAWKEFKSGKMKKSDVCEFYFALEDNLFKLHEELSAKTYKMNAYVSFYVQDPKLRPIHRASVRDRVLLQAIFRILYSIFDRHFIFDSYSCRFEKGTHAGVRRLVDFTRKASTNYQKKIYGLKCDVKRFFHSIDHKILMNLIERKIADKNCLWLIREIVDSFHSNDRWEGTGLPLGNVTSQLFANIYLNELDQFVKHVLKEKYYLRYCDDFIILSDKEDYLARLIPEINCFLLSELKLEMHPQKVQIRKFSQGFDFLGYVVLPHYVVLRTKTKKRMCKKIFQRYGELKSEIIDSEKFNQTMASFNGMLGHCFGNKLKGSLFQELFLK